MKIIQGGGAVKKIYFGYLKDNWIFDNALFPIVINALYTVSTSEKFDDKTCSEASSLIEKLSDFKIILTAHIFLYIFKITGPTSRYLQTKGMDLLTAWNMIDTVKQEIRNINFEFIKKQSENFSKKMNDQLNNMNLPDDLVVKYELPIVRNIRKKKCLMKCVKMKYLNCQ